MSRARVRWAACLPALAAVLLGACSEGDVVRIVLPAPLCERPPDPAWDIISPVCGDRAQHDAVWVREDLAVIVGAAGLAMAWDGTAWSREDPGTDHELLNVAAAADGTVCAVGADGTVALRTAGGWSAQQVAGLGDLRRVNAGGGGFWAVGPDGALVGIAGGRATAAASPVTGDLLDVCAAGDSLWTAAGSAGLHVRAGGAWAAVDPPLLAGEAVRAVAILDDGRLVVLADNLYVREAHGWTRPDIVSTDRFNFGGKDRLRTCDGALWLDGPVGDCGRFELGPDGWQVWSWSVGRAVAPLDRERVLTVSGFWLTWWRDGFAEHDPASQVHDRHVVRFLDGTCVVTSSYWGLETTVEGRLTLLDGLADDTRFRLDSDTGGRSPADFYSFRHSDREIWHFTDGVGRKVADIPGDVWFNQLAALPGGGILVFLGHHGVWRWNGADFEDVSLRDDGGIVGIKPLTVGRDGPVLASDGGSVYAFADDTWIATPLEEGCEVGGVLPDGRVALLSRDPTVAGKRMPSGRYLHVWDPVDGGMTTERTEFLETCESLEIAGAVAGAGGLCVWTRGASMVFRLRLDGLDPAWDLVAGPLDHELRELAVQPDGSLLANDWDRIFLHPGRPD